MFKVLGPLRWATRWLCPLMGVLFLAGLCGCRHHGAYIYSGVDPDAVVVRTDAIFFKPPVDASIRERQVAVLLKAELERNGFNLVSEPQKARYVLSFGVDRTTYAAGTVSRGFLFGPGFTGHTRVVNATDVTVNLHLYPAEQDGTGRVKILWEGSVRASDRVFRALPNATVRNLLVKFGQNFERLMRVEKDYQRMIRREQAGLEPVSAD